MDCLALTQWSADFPVAHYEGSTKPIFQPTLDLFLSPGHSIDRDI
jgi:hypothetical protein